MTQGVPEDWAESGDRQARDAEACSLPGHDRDCALAMLNQSRRRGGIDDIQVAHLLAIGYRAGADVMRRRQVRVHVDGEPTNMVMPLDGSAASLGVHITWWARVRSLYRRWLIIRFKIEDRSEAR